MGEGAMNELVKGMDKHKIDICALREIRWSGKGSEKYEFGTGFCARKHNKFDRLDFEPVNERICKVTVKS
jgi:hypothetical protein